MWLTIIIGTAFFIWFVHQEYNIPRHITYCRQWLKRGFSDRQTWDMDHTFTKFMLPRLERFKEIWIQYDVGGVPCELLSPNHHKMSEKEQNKDINRASKVWLKIIDKMIYALHCIVDEEYDVKYIDTEDGQRYDSKYIKKRYKKVQDGLDMLSKYFMHLWW